ncbi:hypothetical protein KF707_06450 [Candidatus Obscuribacterales bacterium]|nr:hypothetical protein [Candidatus Obscuribacterales bacterium]
MDWDQVSDQSQNGTNGSNKTVEQQAIKPAGSSNDNLHSLFIKDFLLPSDAATVKSQAPEATPVAKSPSAAPPRETAGAIAAPQRIPSAETSAVPRTMEAPLTFSAPQTTGDAPLTFSASPRTMEAPLTFSAPPATYGQETFAPVYGPRGNSNYDYAQGDPNQSEYGQRSYGPPQNFESPQTFGPPQTFAPPQYFQPQGEMGGSQYGPQPGRDMTYRSMSRAMMMAQDGQDRGMGGQGFPPGIRPQDMPRGMRPQDMGPGMRPQDIVAQQIFNGLRQRRGQFQPQQVAQRPDMPPGAPQEQPRQRLFGRGGLFRGGDQRGGDPRGEQPPAKNEPLQKHEFLSKNETGVIKEIQLPGNFKEVQQDPNMVGGANPIQREFQAKGSRSHVTMYEGRELLADEQKSLKAILAKQGKLQPDTPAYDEANMLMGAGYHTFVNDPQVSVGKFNGKDALILTDEDPQQNLVAQTILVPSDKGQFLYAITFDGNKADFPAVKKGLDTIKWRPTPDTVSPPAPGPIRKK